MTSNQASGPDRKDVVLRVLSRVKLASFEGLFDDYLKRRFSQEATLGDLLEVIHDRWSDHDRQTLCAGLGFPENYLPPMMPLSVPERADPVPAKSAPNVKVTGLDIRVRHLKTGTSIRLARIQSVFVSVLLRDPSATVSLEVIRRECEQVHDHGVRSLVQRLKAKFSEIGVRQLLVTEYGLGYRLDAKLFQEVEFVDA